MILTFLVFHHIPDAQLSLVLTQRRLEAVSAVDHCLHLFKGLGLVEFGDLLFMGVPFVCADAFGSLGLALWYRRNSDAN